MIDHTFQKTAVNLDGLLEVLGKNLYSDSDVAIRELVQNAADACHRHRLEDPGHDDYFVRLTCKPQSNQLIIEDNGSGLTYEEVIKFLATIGSGYSRVLRNQTGTEDVVGYFGLGFLTAYIVASKVQISTCSYQSPEKSWKFTSAKGKTYAVAPDVPRDRGTKVILWLEPEYTNLSNTYFLRGILQKYCCLLPTPIFLNDEVEPVNNLEPPWTLDETISALRRNKLTLEFAHLFEPSYEPIAVFPIPQDNEYELKGLLWIQGGSSYASTDNRNLSIFTRNMFITNEDKDLLPRWAGFAGGLIESSFFKPTASRESLQKDKYYKDICDYLRDFLAVSLSTIVSERPETWRRIISRHSQALLGAAISDDRLFETSRDTLKVPTTDGEMTVPELLRRGDGTIYIKPSNSAGHEEILFRARGNPLVKGFLYGAAGFCRKYQEWTGTKVHTFGTEAATSSLLSLAKDVEPSFRALLLFLFENPNFKIELSNFTPEHIPLLIMENHSVVLKNKLEADEADKRISTAALGLARLTTKMEKQTEENTLFINLKNPVIQKLPALSSADQNNVADMLKGMMEILCLDNTREDEGLDSVFASFNTAMMSLLKGND